MDDRSQVEAINRSQMVVTFSVDASVLSANSLFLNAFGVSLEEVNRMFAQDADSDAYRQLWEGLRSGMSQVRTKKVCGPQSLSF
jgi:methyl-accepting chemotaxis protein